MMILSKGPAVSGRTVLLLSAMMGAWVVSALGTLPAVTAAATPSMAAVTLTASEHAKVCHCAHCPGGKLCCCNGGIKVCP